MSGEPWIEAKIEPNQCSVEELLQGWVVEPKHKSLPPTSKFKVSGYRLQLTLEWPAECDRAGPPKRRLSGKDQDQLTILANVLAPRSQNRMSVRAVCYQCLRQRRWW